MRLLQFFSFPVRRRAGFFIAVCLALAACNTPRPSATTVAVQPGEPPAPLKLFVAEAGAYQVTADDLRAASPSLASADPQRLQLTLRGRPQPLRVEGGPGDFRLQFYGLPSDSVYSRENVYLLQWAADGETPARMAEAAAPAPVGAPAETITVTLRREENRQYAPQVETGEHWLWMSMPAPQTQEIPLSLPQARPGAASLRIEVWANTQAAVNPDHHLRALLNGQAVLDQSWDGPGRQTLAGVIPAGVLRQGENTLSLELPGDTGAQADIVFLDWVEISYPHSGAAQGGALAFEGAAAPRKISGLGAAAMVWDVTAPESVSFIAATGGAEVLFQGEAGRRYLAVSAEGFRKPARLAPLVSTPDLRAAGGGAAYVAVGPPDLLAPLQPLLDFHTSQGLQTAAIPVEAIYDQFGDGFPEPQAVRNFLAYAAQGWNPVPQYLLLVGDSTYDPRGYNAPPEANRLPSFFVWTDFGGQTVSDTQFALWGEATHPALAVGRMPARTPEQVRTLVEKTLAYARQPAAEWQKRILAIADGQEASFSGDAQVFLDSFGGLYQPTLFAPPAGASEANQQVAAYLNEGYLLVGYFGHGSLVMWGKDKLFTTQDVARLSNVTALPVVINMNCLTGFFVHPKTDSMAETLLWQPGGGAVAVLAPTSLTLPSDQALLSSAFVNVLKADPSQPLGQILLQAQQQMPLEYSGALDVLETFLFYGDPALRLPASAATQPGE